MEYNQKIHCSVGSCKYNDVTVQEMQIKGYKCYAKYKCKHRELRKKQCV